MDDDMNWERLARYVAGECSPDEAVEVERWIGRDASRRAAATDMRTIWTNAEVGPAGWDAEGAWRAVESRLNATSSPAAAPARRAAPRFRIAPRSPLSIGLRVAAAAAIVAGAGLLGIHLRRSANEPVAGPPVAMREYVTPRGQRADFNLPDGTHVVLSVASRLRVPVGYGAGARPRDVYLEGEAYFEVTHDERRPFAVHTASAVARDLGTRFGVRAYPDEVGMQVAVAEGTVALRQAAADQGGERRLTARQLGQLDQAGVITVQSGVDLDRYLAWTDGRLVFDNTPLREALPQLGRWYDLDFRLGDSSLGVLPLTATFTNQPTDDVLQLLALTLGLREERRGDAVTYYRAGTGR